MTRGRLIALAALVLAILLHGLGWLSLTQSFRFYTPAPSDQASSTQYITLKPVIPTNPAKPKTISKSALAKPAPDKESEPSSAVPSEPPTPLAASPKADAPTPAPNAETSAENPTQPNPLAIIAPNVSRPPPSKLHFKMYYNGFPGAIARMTHEISYPSDSTYVIHTESEAMGLISLVYSGVLIQHSEGDMSPQGFKPRRYLERRGKAAEKAANIRYEENLISFSASTQTYPLPHGIQDLLSIIYQVGLLCEQRETQGDATLEGWAIPLVIISSVEPSVFTLAGYENLEANINGQTRSVRTLRVVRLPKVVEKEIRLELWYAPEYQWLPLRFRISDSKQQVFDFQIENVSVAE